MCYNQKRKEQMFWWLADRKVSDKRKIELRIRRAPSNASVLSRDSKWPGIRYWEYLQIRRCFWYLMSGFFVFCVSFFKKYLVQIWKKSQIGSERGTLFTVNFKKILFKSKKSRYRGSEGGKKIWKISKSFYQIKKKSQIGGERERRCFVNFWKSFLSNLKKVAKG